MIFKGMHVVTLFEIRPTQQVIVGDDSGRFSVFSEEFLENTGLNPSEPDPQLHIIRLDHYEPVVLVAENLVLLASMPYGPNDVVEYDSVNIRLAAYYDWHFYCGFGPKTSTWVTCAQPERRRLS